MPSKEYGVSEIFISEQGEGARWGSVNVFIRFSGCTETCRYCDTDFDTRTPMTSDQIVSEVVRLMPAEPRAVICTGGEPLIQYDQELYDKLKNAKTFIAIETSGSTKPKAAADFVVCSPKVAGHVVAANFPQGVNELRYVRHQGQGIPQPTVEAEHYYLSPEFRGEVLQHESLEWCRKLARENPKWKISIQTHKLLKIR